MIYSLSKYGIRFVLLQQVHIYMINLIDQSGQFKQKIPQYLSQSLVLYPTATANISIFGTQSSGKSTLVNTAFGTHFPTLDTRQDRHRCTRGVWSQNNGKFNVIDTEGFDSVQRNKNQRIIQRQIALFCLAISDVVIVNVWMNQIGRYQGGQMHILNAIIHAASFLVQSQTKTLLFVVKDCSREADHGILKQEIQKQMSKIMDETPKKGPQSLKFNIQYFFMSHYIYQHQQYQKQAAKLASLIRVKKSNLNVHEPKDRIVYMTHLWQTIVANEGEIDLRLEQQALRVYICNRIRGEAKDAIQQQVLAQTRIGKFNNYDRLYQHYVKKGFQVIKSKIPKYVDEKTIKDQMSLLEDELEYTIQKHFTDVILPNEEQYLLKQVLSKQLEKSQKSIQLQKIIIENRKKVLGLYKLMVHGHKQSQILIKRFAERITQESAIFERQVSHLFNIFETKLESEINKQLDRQVRKLKFEGLKITQKFKTLCKQFQYNEWQVNTKQIWQKATYRTLSQTLCSRLQSFRFSSIPIPLFSPFLPSRQPSIIASYKSLQIQTQQFIKQLLSYLQQQDTGEHYSQKIKQILRHNLQQDLLRERRRFRMSMLMLGLLLFLMYGEVMWLLKLVGVKKRMRRYVTYLYYGVSVILIGGSLAKRIISNKQSTP